MSDFSRVIQDLPTMGLFDITDLEFWNFCSFGHIVQAAPFAVDRLHPKCSNCDKKFNTEVRTHCRSIHAPSPLYKKISRKMIDIIESKKFISKDMLKDISSNILKLESDEFRGISFGLTYIEGHDDVHTDGLPLNSEYCRIELNNIKRQLKKYNTSNKHKDREQTLILNAVKHDIDCIEFVINNIQQISFVGFNEINLMPTEFSSSGPVAGIVTLSKVFRVFDRFGTYFDYATYGPTIKSSRKFMKILAYNSRSIHA